MWVCQRVSRIADADDLILFNYPASRHLFSIDLIKLASPHVFLAIGA